MTFRSDLVLDDDDLNESEFQSIQVNPQPEFTSNVSSTVGLQDNNEQWLENVISNKVYSLITNSSFFKELQQAKFPFNIEFLICRKI